MNRDIKLFVNKILVTENAKEIQEKDLLINSELDSFGYAILFIELDDKYKCFNKEYLDGIDYNFYTLNDLINRIKQCS